MGTDLPPILHAVDLAELLDFSSERAAAEWVRKSRVPVVRVAGRVLVRTAALLAWLEAHEEEPESEEEIAARVKRVAEALTPRRRR